MPTFMQKIRLVIRGWNRRREEKQREFLAQNQWGPSAAPPPSAAPRKVAALQVDMDGLIVAYLDDSGHFHYYLDIKSGEVIESRDPLSVDHYRRVPSHSAEGDDRRAFLATLKDSSARARLASAESFRSELAKDRALERGWYNFRNDRAIAAIEAWLREVGVK